ncbi:MAG: hypothetical protein KF752_07705 [Pirellulaceae bacterium]|nr:hypothetical protein [Pirellulaceae bacterium]
MRRFSHDLTGAIQRISKLNDQFDNQVQSIAEVWKDDVGRGFLRQHTSDVRPQISQLIAELSVLVEQFEGICKQLQDPDLS